MKLQKRLAVLMAGTIMVTSAMPVWAMDYSNHWAKESIETWSKKGIVEGYADGTFKPSQNVTRAELATFITRVFGLTEVGDAKTYEDVVEGQWYDQAVNAVSSAKIMNDYGTQFKPSEFATREETAYALANAYELTGKSNKSFTDEHLISAWADEQMNAMVNNGILQGKTDTTIAPQDAVTRAEVVTMLDRLTAELYHEAGTYTADVEGNVVINSKDVVLKDMTITGNLYVAEGVGTGDVTLDNTTINGKVIIEGGGENSVKFTNGSRAADVKVEKVNGKVRVFVDDQSKVESVVLKSGAKLEGNMTSVEVQTKQAVNVIAGTIENFVVAEQAQGAEITLGEKVQIKEAAIDTKVEVKGKGTIEKALINAEGVKLETQPKETILADNIKVTINGKELGKETVNKPTTGTGNGSSSDNNNDNNSGGSSEPVKRPRAVVTPSQVYLSDIARTGKIEIEVNLKDTHLITDNHRELAETIIYETSNIKGSRGGRIVDRDTFTLFVEVDAYDLPSSWDFKIPSQFISANRALPVSISIIDDIEENLPPDDLERLTTTPGAVTVSEGDIVEFTVTTSSALFIQGPDDAFLFTNEDRDKFEVGTGLPTVSADGRTLTVKAIFTNVKASGRFWFTIPKEWMNDGKDRDTDIITVTKKSSNSDSDESEQTQFENKVLELVNIERQKEGLKALQMDEKVRDIARLKSEDMRKNNYFDHTSPTYGTPFDMLKSFGISYSSAGENIAQGQTTPEQVVNSWMNSEGHRKNILTESFTHIGIGYDANGHYWTQMFIGK